MLHQLRHSVPAAAPELQADQKVAGVVIAGFGSARDGSRHVAACGPHRDGANLNHVVNAVSKPLC
jgi:hypothetical protein